MSDQAAGQNRDREKHMPESVNQSVPSQDDPKKETLSDKPSVLPAPKLDLDQAKNNQTSSNNSSPTSISKPAVQASSVSKISRDQGPVATPLTKVEQTQKPTTEKAQEQPTTSKPAAAAPATPEKSKQPSPPASAQAKEQPAGATPSTAEKKAEPRPATSPTKTSKIQASVTDAKTPEVSPTAQSTHDQFGLARSSGQRGAEILAGIRSEILGTAISKALVKPKGQIIAHFMLKAMGGGNTASINFLATRTEAFAALIREAIKGIPNPIVVEVAAGFSPRGIEFATKMPHVKVIEVDLPDLVEEKKERLKNVHIPENIQWIGADLGVTFLSDILKNTRVHVIAAEGLLPYFSHEEQTRITRHFLACLEPGGVFITDFSWQPGFDLMKQGGNFFTRQAGRPLGMVMDQEEPKLILKLAGFADVQVHLPTDLADHYSLTRPVSNNQLIVVAKKST